MKKNGDFYLLELFAYLAIAGLLFYFMPKIDKNSLMPDLSLYIALAMGIIAALMHVVRVVFTYAKYSMS